MKRCMQAEIPASKFQTYIPFHWKDRVRIRQPSANQISAPPNKGGGVSEPSLKRRRQDEEDTARLKYDFRYDSGKKLFYLHMPLFFCFDDGTLAHFRLTGGLTLIPSFAFLYSIKPPSFVDRPRPTECDQGDRE